MTKMKHAWFQHFATAFATISYNYIYLCIIQSFSSLPYNNENLHRRFFFFLIYSRTCIKRETLYGGQFTLSAELMLKNTL